jgi:DNA (cytosine-5)-methyltransferase 1
MDLAFHDHPAFEFVGCSEYDKHASAVLNFHWPEVKNYGDITKISIEDLPTHQVLVGGTPCQSFSEAGKREGLKGKSGLLLHYLEILKVHRPRYFIWENVTGSLNSTSGWDLARLQSEVAELGYSYRWEVLNARHYGIPQNRERIFIVGYNRKFKRGREILCKGHLDESVYRREYTDYQDGEEETVDDGFKVLAYSKSTRDKHLDHRIRPDGTANTLNTGDGCRSQSSATFVASFNRTEGLRTKKKVAHALASSDWRGVNRNTSSNVVAHDDYRIRKLMPIECERLMGWQDEWTKYGDYGNEIKPIPDTQRYKMCGNGVVTPCVIPIRDLILAIHKAEIDAFIKKSKEG